VGCWRRVWVVASTLNATAFKEKQHPQTRRQQQNRVHHALTQEVNSIEVTNFNVHNGLVKITSGQLRNLGSTLGKGCTPLLKNGSISKLITDRWPVMMAEVICTPERSGYRSPLRLKAISWGCKRMT